MKWPILIAIGAAALAVAGCNDSSTDAAATPAQEMKDGHPVVHLPPVETHPFEDGYSIGYDFGRVHARPGMPIPTEKDAQRVAHDEIGDRPERTERWERGFAEGYTDGFRKVVTGKK